MGPQIEPLHYESILRITEDWSGLVSTVNAHSSELRRMRVLQTEMLTRSGDIPSLFVLLPAAKNILSTLKNPYKAMFSKEMRLFAVCPVTLKAVACGPDGMGWEVCIVLSCV